MSAPWPQLQPGAVVQHIDPTGSAPTPPDGWYALHHRCGRPVPGGPLGEIARQMQSLLDADVFAWDAAPSPSGTLAGEGAAPAPEHALLAAARRLGAVARDPLVLVLESVDEADDVTLRALRKLQTREHLPFAMLLASRPDDRLQEAAPVAAPTRLDLPALQLVALVGKGPDLGAIATALGADPELLRVALDEVDGVRIDASQRVLLPSALQDRVRAAIPNEQERALRRAWIAHQPADSAASLAAAAEQLAALGEIAEAVERYLQAAERVRGDGDQGDAITYARAAVELAPKQGPEGLKATLALALALLHTAGISGAERGTDLQAAREALDDFGPVDPALPVELRSRAATVRAWVLYEIGTDDALGEALDSLSDAIDALYASGARREAASLLNDQAAVWIRLGKRKRARHLLEESRRIFSSPRQPSDGDREELAESLHLLAQLSLAAGDEAAAALPLIDQAIAIQSELGRPRAGARSREVRARILAASGDLDRAAAELHQTWTLQHELRDPLGLARTTGALADLLGRLGRFDDAQLMLSDSVEMNVRAGSVRGLDHNMTALKALISSEGSSERWTEVEARIQAARVWLY